MELGIEFAWASRHWQNRMFACILGTVVVNAFLAYKNLGQHDIRQPDFVEQLACQMMQNPLPGCPANVAALRYKRARQKEAGKDGSEAGAKEELDHVMGKMSDLPTGSAKCGYCYMQGCQNNAYAFCRTCSKPGKPFWLCGFTGSLNRQCVSRHIQECLTEKFGAM